jgi:dolichyl-phosphate beta-glucosyltransferase
VAITTSFVIPAYNEAARLGAGFERLRPTLETMGTDSTEVIVIDDGSSDDTARVAHEVYGHLPHTLFVRQPVNRGKGAAVRLGLGLASGDYVIATDADMAIKPNQFPDVVQRLHDVALVPGSRVHERHIRYDSVLRTLAASTFNRFVRHYAHTTLRDTQCGCKGFQRGPGRLLGLLGMIDGFAYDAEMFYLASQLSIQVEPLSVTWDDVSGSSVKMGRDSLTMLRDIRSLKSTHYENPVVELVTNVDVAAVADAARQARVQGLVVARGDENALLVLPRDGAPAGLGVAVVLDGKLRTATIEELRGRTFEAV